MQYYKYVIMIYFIYIYILSSKNIKSYNWKIYSLICKIKTPIIWKNNIRLHEWAWIIQKSYYTGSNTQLISSYGTTTTRFSSSLLSGILRRNLSREYYAFPSTEKRFMRSLFLTLWVYEEISYESSRYLI